MANNAPLVLTVPEAAQLLRISKSNAFSLVRQGKIPAIHLGKRILIPRASLEKLLTETELK